MTDQATQLTLSEIVSQLGESIPHDEGLSSELAINNVVEFYGLPRPDQDFEPQYEIELAKQHLTMSREIGRHMDHDFLAKMQSERGNENVRIVDVLALRGSVALQPVENNPLAKLNSVQKGAYSQLPIGIVRNGETASVYFPSEDEIDQSIQTEVNKPGEAVFRIKDMGNATGATSGDLMEELLDNGVDLKNIYIHSTIGTEYAINTMRARLKAREIPEEQIAAFFDKNVLFSVEGQIAYEGGDLQKGEPGWNYINRVRQRNGKPFEEGREYTMVNSADWGDQNLTKTNNWQTLGFFMNEFSRVMEMSGQADEVDMGRLEEALVKQKGIAHN